MSNALKLNTTLTRLDLDSVSERNSARTSSVNSILIKSTVNDIGEAGMTSLSDALKSNATLTHFDLEGEHKETTYE